MSGNRLGAVNPGKWDRNSGNDVPCELRPSDLQQIVRSLECETFLPCLTFLDLGHNRLNADGCIAIAQALQRRATSPGSITCLSQIDVRGNPIGTRFMDVQQALRDVPGMVAVLMDDDGGADEVVSDGFCGCCTDACRLPSPAPRRAKRY